MRGNILYRLIYSGVIQTAQFYLFMWLFWRTPSTLKIAKSSPPQHLLMWAIWTGSWIVSHDHKYYYFCRGITWIFFNKIFERSLSKQVRTKSKETKKSLSLVFDCFSSNQSQEKKTAVRRASCHLWYPVFQCSRSLGSSLIIFSSFF